ncbi:MAG: hypothetical protein O2960_22510 [Verrucomicrobia bacterium]|nr:hypothetical protein [Verrucomicrobiota bacterium]
MAAQALQHGAVGDHALPVQSGIEYLHPWIATPPQAVDFVDCGETATEYHGNPTLRASGLDESQKSATPQAAGNEPAAIQKRVGIARRSGPLIDPEIIFLEANQSPVSH